MCPVRVLCRRRSGNESFIPREKAVGKMRDSMETFNAERERERERERGSPCDLALLYF